MKQNCSPACGKPNIRIEDCSSSVYFPFHKQVADNVFTGPLQSVKAEFGLCSHVIELIYSTYSCGNGIHSDKSRVSSKPIFLL